MMTGTLKNMHVYSEIDELITLEGAAKKHGRNIRDEDLSMISDAALVVDQGKVQWCGPRTQLPPIYNEAETTKLGGASVVPGFIDCHTHSLFAGDRTQEFEWRQQGQTYQEISAKGGGILSTVRETRKVSLAQLTQIGQARMQRFVQQGVTTVETKSGYGLDLETELKILRAGRALSGPRILNTYLGAHSRSPDFPDLGAYMDFMLNQVLPQVMREKLADRIDIYIEKGFYDLDLARKYFSKARELGLPITAHVEQLSDFGGTELALQFDPQSVDHLVFLSEQAITAVAKSKATAVLLPASDFYLKMAYPPARALMDRGACVALSTDFNPGTSPTQDLSLVGVLARIEMKMSLAEVYSAFTVGAAHALGLDNEMGSLTPGKSADFSVLHGSWRELFYSVGHHPVHSVYKSGKSLAFK